MKVFDSHCHLDDRVFVKDLNDVLKRAKQASVYGIMIAGISSERTARAVNIAATEEGVYAAVGVHPHNAKYCSETDIEFLKDLARHEKIRGWGETGLDFNRMFSPKNEQEKCFICQLETANELGLPLILHERDSSGRLLELLKSRPNNNWTGVVHCFTGTEAELWQYLDLGFHIGITGILTIHGRGKRLREFAPLIPVDRLLIETDAPYLVPAPERNRTRRNEPAFLKSILLKLAQVRKEEPEELAAITWANTCRLFNIGSE